LNNFKFIKISPGLPPPPPPLPDYRRRRPLDDARALASAFNDALQLAEEGAGLDLRIGYHSWLDAWRLGKVFFKYF
jgi:hypothetical protein